MKIGFDAKRAFHNRSGLGNYSRDLIRILAENFPEEELFLFNPKKRRQIKFGQDWDQVQEIRPSSLINKIVHPMWRSRAIINSMEKLEIEVYHGLSNELPVGISQSPIKSVVTIHDLIFMRYPKLYRPSDRVVYRQKVTQACKDADCIVAISEQTKADLVKFMKVRQERIQVIYQSCHPAFGVEIPETERKKVLENHGIRKDFVLSVGTLEKRKNQESIIMALAHIDDVDLVLVGKCSSYYSRLKKIASKEGVLHRIHFVEQIDTTELSALYQEAKVFVYPSLFEGFGIPLIEAMKSRTPVITTEGGVFSEVAGPGSIYLNPEDHLALAKHVNELLKNSSRMEEMKEEGLIFVERFKEDRLAQQWMEVYRNL